MATTDKGFPYRRDVRPPTPEALGTHVDFEFEKIERALHQIAVQLAALTPPTP
jgi:hypothetical protein